MIKEDCIFCKIAEGKIPCHKVYEDQEHLAFLDIFPLVKGQTLVITKKHYDSYQFDLPDDVYTKLFLVAKKVGKAIDKGLKAIRTFLVVEGMEVSHVHIKLYPVFKVNRNVAPPQIDKKQLKDWYSGYIITLHGPKAKDKELAEVAKDIKTVLT